MRGRGSVHAPAPAQHERSCPRAASAARGQERERAAARLGLAVLVALCLSRAADGTDSADGLAAHVDGTALPQPERLVAVGDVHGDLQALKGALRLAGVLHAKKDVWTGGRTVVVQVGDQLDRGDDELAILALIRKLQTQARAAGGALHVLYGNHEHLASTTQGFRYATKGTYENFARWEEVCREKGRLSTAQYDDNHCELFQGPLMCPGDDMQCQAVAHRLPRDMRSRFHALYPGGCISKGVLAKERSAVLVVGDTLFTHAGLRIHHLTRHARPEDALHDLNLEMSAYFAGQIPQISEKTSDVIWTRAYGQVVTEQTCRELQALMGALPGKVSRIVVGHTIQEHGVTSACNGAVWRIDVGMSRGTYGNKPQVLEILPGGRVKVLTYGASAGKLGKLAHMVRRALSALKRLISRRARQSEL